MWNNGEDDGNEGPEEQVNLTLGLDHGEGDDNEGAPPQRRKEVPKDTKKLIFDFLLAKAKSGELKGHETGEASTKFSVNIRTVQRIWKDGKECLNQGTMVDFSSGKSKRGCKKKEVDLSKLRELPISSRGTLEDVSKELGIGKRKLHSLKKEGLIERVSNSIKPFLT
ncbi:hypothetical protein QOZ80_5AG0397530 [Eleusine coracana subsp. coracana]|nr:hypothetical protein QOZ80_5AG0397530 [Eleusine coracana subsp. coracana]